MSWGDCSLLAWFLVNSVDLRDSLACILIVVVAGWRFVLLKWLVGLMAWCLGVWSLVGLVLYCLCLYTWLVGRCSLFVW